MVALCLVLLSIFAGMDRGADLVYGALRFALLHLFVLAVRSVFFRESLDRYVDTGSFVADFHELSAAVKVGFTLGMLAVYLLTGVLCFVL